MSDVIEMPARKAARNPADTLSSKFGHDSTVLQFCADWRAARAQQEKNDAEYDLATGWGHLDDHAIELDTAPLDRMQGVEFHLAQWPPHTMLGAVRAGRLKAER